MLCCCQRVAFGSVCHNYPTAGGGIHIDIIHSGACTPDKFELIPCIYYPGGNLCTTPDKKGVIVRDD